MTSAYPSPQFAELMHDHEMIDLLARRLSTLLDEGASPVALSATLNHLVKLVADHLATEDGMIYTLAMQAQPGAAAENVERVRMEFEQLKANWGEYLQLWSPGAIEADGPGFAAATRAMLPRLRDRVRLENELLIAVALQRGAQGSAHA